MGICDNPNKKEEKKPEVEIDDSSIHQINSFLYDICPSICKIIFFNKVGTGFFIKLYKANKPIFLLMTNEHIIEKEMIENKQEIEVDYDNQKKRIKIILDKNERFIESYNEKLNIDCTIVEILKKDNVNEDFFLLPNINYNINNYDELKDKKIYVVQFPEGKYLSHSKGKLTYIDKYEFTHKAGTKGGSSGSPIFLANTTRVIGIHKSGVKSLQENYGDFIFPIINSLKGQNELKIIVRLNNGYFNVFGKRFVENNKDKCEIFFNGKSCIELKSAYDGRDYNFKDIFEKHDGILEITLKETKIIRNMDDMFYFGYYEIISIDFEKWDVSNVTSMKNMFERCNNIKGISNWNTSNVTNMSYMFSECDNIPDISKWDTSKVLDMSYMFCRCDNIPDISNWDTSNVKNMEGLFYYSISLSSLPNISKWNVNNVESMAYMFDFCKSLKSLPNISNWITSSVKDMSYMFHNCWALTSFPDISNWNIYNAKNMSHMFHNCWGLTSFPFLNWDISNAQDMSFMFHNFPLSLIRFKWNISGHQNTFHMFTNFYNYHNPIYGNNIINVKIFIRDVGLKVLVHAYSDMMAVDLIDKFYKKNNNSVYPFGVHFSFNNKNINDINNMYLTLSELGIGDMSLIDGDVLKFVR